MTKCKECGHTINDTTDDNFNADHSKIHRDECGNWQVVYSINSDNVVIMAKIIFDKCCEYTIEEVCAYDEWDDISSDTKQMYVDIAEAVIEKATEFDEKH